MRIEALISRVSKDVQEERRRQNGKWGVQRHSLEKWFVIASEEVGEVAEAIQAQDSWSKSTDADNLYEECIQVAAVFQAMAEQVLEKQITDESANDRFSKMLNDAIDRDIEAFNDRIIQQTERNRQREGE